jgi:hypothetical protein
MATAKPETANRAWWACRAISIRVVNLDGCVAISGLEILKRPIRSIKQMLNGVESVRALIEEAAVRLLDTAVSGNPPHS